MSKLKYILFTFTTAIILWQCASMQTPSGGEKDTTAPLVLRSTPSQGATNSSPELIEIQFDEYIKLNNLQNELLISPPLETKPIISPKGKSLFIELQEELSPNKTYTFNFGSGIADYHENNTLKDYSLVFSTGNELDSLSLSGNLNTCPVNTLPDNIIVGIYQKDSLRKDSTIYLQKPDYFGLVNENGAYKIEHVRTGTFELIAFEDLNANYLYDSATEQIAFHDSLINLSDSSLADIWLFKEEIDLKLLDSRAKETGRIHWAYNQEITDVDVLSDIKLNLYYKTEIDSLFVWPQVYPIDSFYVWAKVGNRLDSVLIKPDSLLHKKLNINLPTNYLKSSDNLHLYTDAPIVSIDTSKIKLLADSVEIAYSLSHTDFELELDFEQTKGSTYNIVFSENALTSLYENSNDSSHFSFYTKAENQLASLKVNVPLSYDNYFIELIKDSKVIDKLVAGEQPIFNQLLPSTYKVRLTLDTNNDGEWTEGNYSKNILPEKTFYYTGELNLRANWELEIEITPVN